MRALPRAPVSTHRTRSPVLLGTPAGRPQARTELGAGGERRTTAGAGAGHESRAAGTAEFSRSRSAAGRTERYRMTRSWMQ
mgnify:CR=1 FL=1